MMERVSGLLLRYHRLKQNISQEGLGAGICVVSYVSKIEQGKVEASREIIAALFKRLHIIYHDDPEEIRIWKEQLQSAIEGLYYGQRSLSEEEALLKQRAELVNSPLCASILLFQAYRCFIEHEDLTHMLDDLDIFIPCMSDEQLFFYHYLKGSDSTQPFKQALSHLQKAGQYGDLCILDQAIGHLYTDVGDYSMALDHHQNAYRKACDEGHVKMMKDASLQIANCYSNMKAESLMLKYYTQCSHICRFMNDRELEGTIAYNIGSTYLQWKQYDLARSYLMKSLDLLEEVNIWHRFLIMQKLSLLYEAMGDKGSGRVYLEQMAAYIDPQKAISHKLLQFVSLRYEEDHLQNDDYLHVLEEICEADKEQVFYGLRVFHMHYLIEVYQSHRRYKEAAELMVKINDFPVIS